MASTEKLPIEPYARLLTMLGEQLIKNERIALIELIKNSYDADADWVQVSFLNFDTNWNSLPSSKIVIEDDGDGMNEEIIRKHLTHPATPEKKRRKKDAPMTKKGRYIQGEKGIGRFAILKLGKRINIRTRAKDESIEHVVDYDFSEYDDEFLSQNGESKEILLKELGVSYRQDSPLEIVSKSITQGNKTKKRKEHGTRIEISNLKGSWSEAKVEKVYNDIARLESKFMNRIGTAIGSKTDKFDIYIYKDKQPLLFDNHADRLQDLIENCAVLKYENGHYSESDQTFIFDKNGVQTSLNLNDVHVKGRTDVHEYFGGESKSDPLRKSECGDFEFGFYIFDFSNKADNRFTLSKEDKNILRQHRIYLYRDGVRVYPYGEPDDDWLKIDMYRGTFAAGHYLSNDQVFGYVNISHSANPHLMDKTNREGLIETGRALDDFQALLQILLAHIRQKDYSEYQTELQKKNRPNRVSEDEIQNQIDGLKEFANSKDNNVPKSVRDGITNLEKNYKAEKNYLVRRAETTEELAGVGLSVETTSHDIMSMLQKMENRLDNLIQDCESDEIEISVILTELQVIRGQVGFVSNQMNGIQSLFRSSKQRRKKIRIEEYINKVQQIYRKILRDRNIDLEVTTIGTSPLVASTTDAVLLQVLINLFDNSIYWLDATSSKSKKIEITLNSDEGTLIFSDNGPGIDKSDEPYVFEPFHSGRGEEGRGLGLYIARQLLRRQDYDIELASLKADKKLKGANFVISFVKE